MSSQTMGIIVGGLLPAVLFGLSGVFAKASTTAGIGVGPYLMLLGGSVVAVGVCTLLIERNTTVSVQSGIHAALSGATYGCTGPPKVKSEIWGISTSEYAQIEPSRA